MSTNNFSFVVRNGLVVNGSFTANSTVVNAAAVNATSIGLTSNVSVGANVSINTTAVKVDLTTIDSTSLQLGNSSSNLTFTASNLAINGVNVNTMISGNAATAYNNAVAIATNASQLSTGTVPTGRLPASSTSQAGIVQLVDSISNASITVAATANSVKSVYDYAATIAASGTPPSGSNTNVQYNNSGAFGGAAGFTFNSTTNTVTVGTATINSTIYSGTANNANNLGGVAAASFVNTSGAYTITGIHTYQVNAVVGNTTVNTQLSNASILLANSTSTSVLDLTSLRLGNSTTNVVISNTVSSFGGNVSVTGTANVTGNVTVGASGFLVGNGNFITTVNATNITTGTLVTDRLPATANITTAVNVGANVNLSTSTINTGNSTVNSSISATQIFTDGTLTVESTSRFNSDLMVHGNTIVTPTINATGFTYGAQSYSISQSTSTNGLFFKPDGTRFYTVSRGTTRIYTYNVAEPWTLSGASYVSNSSISLQTTFPLGIYIKPDGLKAYVVSNTSPATVFQYSLNETWGNSFTYDTVSLNISATSDSNATSIGAQDITFSPDGKYFFVTTDINSSATIHRYELGTSWDITTGAYSGNSYLNEGYQNSPTGIGFTDSGMMMFVLGNQLDKIDTFRLSTPWSLATVQYVGFSTVNVSSSSGEGQPTAIYLKQDLSKVYLTGLDLTTVYDYIVPVANTYITGNSQLGSLTVAGRTDTIEANVSNRLSVGTNVLVTPLQIRVGNSSANVIISNNQLNIAGATVNSTVYSGTANNSLFLGGTAAASYQTTAGLSANVATLTANNSLFLGGTAAASYVNTSGNFTVAGNINFTGTNTNFTTARSGANVSINTTAVFVGSATVNTSITGGQVSISGVTVNSTIYQGTANNANNLGGVAAASYTNTSGAYTISGVHTHSANVIINATANISNLSINAGYGSIAPVFGVRAWAAIDGVTPTVLGSGNMTVDRLGAGVYRFTFATAMPDTNYCVTTGVGDAISVTVERAFVSTRSTSNVVVVTYIGTGDDLADVSYLAVTVVR